MSWGTSEHTWIARATNHPARPGLSLQSHRGSRDQQKDEGLQGLRRLRCPQQGQAPGPPLLVGILGGLSPPAQPLSHGNKPLTAGIAPSWPHSPTRGRGGGDVGSFPCAADKEEAMEEAAGSTHHGISGTGCPQLPSLLSTQENLRKRGKTHSQGTVLKTAP